VNIIKKHFPTIILIGVVLLFLLASYIGTHNPPERLRSYTISQSDGTTKYILAEGICEFLYSASPSECVRSFRKHERFYTSAILDAYGRLVLIMNEDEIKSLIASDVSRIDKLQSDVKSVLEVKIEILPENKGIVYYSSAEGMNFYILKAIQGPPTLGELQMLGGIDPDEISVEVTLKNFNTGNTVWHGFMPGDSFEIFPEEWDV
jgi:hypothetical protein